MKKKIITILLIAVMAAGISYIVAYYVGKSQRNAIYEELKEQTAAETPTATPTPTAPAATKIPEKTKSPEETETPTPKPTPKPYISPIDFTDLWNINTDVKAWIEIPDSDIAYPILQHPTEDDYYLDHTIEDYAGFPGSIFLRRSSLADFSEFNTVIYGHNMLDGTMFAHLTYYEDPEYMKTHREIKIYTPSAEYTYKVFAAVVYSDIDLPSYYDNTDKEACQRFLDSLGDSRDFRNHFMDDVEVTPDDHIITLSTCLGVDLDIRYLVLAVREEKDETKE